jgi:glutaconyl-CoA/methylmalonyl-CoA decarboxylase subunit gamma
MQYEVEIGGKRRQVVVTRAGGGLAVSVDGWTHYVDAVRVDPQTMSLVVDRVQPAEHSTSGAPQDPRDAVARVYDVTIAPVPGGGDLQVHVGPVPVTVTVNGRRRYGQAHAGGGAGSGPQRIVAPMPGKIVRVLVAAGDTVGARQPVVVVEAMKMENELRAGREGTVAEIHVRQGMSVEAGALLLVIQ